ncbi:hypothetical protein [Neisseria yangbaofengii]|uniref:hypothetical protein n=1 Tax=Neisseria yangbaofengii TaxID=2709396 RepID=UPI00197D3A02|nr:hypothetical protein [Neisseria yangbaofengii]
MYGWGNPDAIKYVGTAAATDPVYRAATAPEQIWLVKCTQDALYCSNMSYDGKDKRPTDNKAEIGDKRQIFDIKELKPSESTGVITISNSGILNPLNDALKNAVKQNSWQTAGEEIVVIYNPPTTNYLSELLYAAYDKANDLIGGPLPLTNAEKANVRLYQHAYDNNFKIDLSNHSRGGLTASVSLQNANRNGLKNIPIRESRFYGTATNVQDYANQLANENKYSDSKAYSTVHYTDFVGRSPLAVLRSKYIVGGNQPTGGVEDRWFLYLHSGYSWEIPKEYLQDENGHDIDKNGNKVDKTVGNPYLKEFKQIWINGKNHNINQDNLSLPVLVQPTSKIKE